MLRHARTFKSWQYRMTKHSIYDESDIMRLFIRIFMTSSGMKYGSLIFVIMLISEDSGYSRFARYCFWWQNDHVAFAL